PAGFSPSDATPALLSHLPAVVHQGFVAGYAQSIQTVFLVAVPIAALAFLVTWLIPQVELQQWTPTEAPSTTTVTATPSIATQSASPGSADPAHEPRQSVLHLRGPVDAEPVRHRRL